MSPMRRALFLGQVWLLTAAIRLALWVLPFSRVRRLVRRWGRRPIASAGRCGRKPEDLARAVRCVARYLPRAHCLTQALAAEVLLSRAGHEPQLRIGVARGLCGELNAHAWVENGGVVVIGATMLDHFVPLPAVELR